jgi:hypothetical protein
MASPLLLMIHDTQINSAGLQQDGAEPYVFGNALLSHANQLFFMKTQFICNL